MNINVDARFENGVEKSRDCLNARPKERRIALIALIVLGMVGTIFYGVGMMMHSNPLLFTGGAILLVAGFIYIGNLKEVHINKAARELFRFFASLMGSFRSSAAKCEQLPTGPTDPKAVKKAAIELGLM